VRKRWIILPMVLAALLAATAAEQDKKREAQLRTVRGAVIDKKDNPIASAAVYLKNLRTETTKTSVSDDTGHYRFSRLDPNVDYEIHAEHGDLTSPKRVISSFDSRKEIVIELKVGKKKGEK